MYNKRQILYGELRQISHYRSIYRVYSDMRNLQDHSCEHNAKIPIEHNGNPGEVRETAEPEREPMIREEPDVEKSTQGHSRSK